MYRLFSAKPLLAAALAFGALAASSAAQARTDVVFSLGIQAPVGYAQPVYVQPQSYYYVQPQPVYEQPQSYYYVQPQPVYYQPHRYHHSRAVHRYGPWGDADRDGVPNRYDHAPNNPYRR